MPKYFWIAHNKAIRNNKLTELVFQIGKRCRTQYPGPLTRTEDIKRGIKHVSHKMNSRKKGASRNQIKALLQHERERKIFRNHNHRYLKIPNNAHDIFKTIMDIVFRDKQILMACQNFLYKELEPTSDGKKACRCRENLVNDTYQLLLSNKHVKIRKLHENFHLFHNDIRQCDKKT